MLQRIHDRWRAWLIAFDFIVFIICGVMAVALHFYVISPQQLNHIPNFFGWFEYSHQHIYFYFLVIIFIAIIQVMIFLLRQDYDRLKLFSENFWLYFHHIPSLLWNFIFIGMLLFYWQEVTISRLVIIYYFIFIVCALFLSRLLLRSRYSIERPKLAFYKKHQVVRIVLVGFSTKIISRIRSELKKDPIIIYQVIATYNTQKKVQHLQKTLLKKQMLKQLTNKTINLKNRWQFKQLLDHDLIDTVICNQENFSIMNSNSLNKEMLHIRDLCYRAGCELLYLSSTNDLHLQMEKQYSIFNQFTLLREVDYPLDHLGARILKRITDLLISSFAILFSLPLFLVVAFLIKLDSPGPVFFKQERIGQDRRKFSIYKLRTMYTQSQNASDRKWGSATDTRTTKIGRILRNSSIDELPQFVNVWLGHMSVVGPRPERPYFVGQFRTQIKDYMRRHAVKSGITGLAQIYGCRGDTSIRKRIKYDILYIEKWTIFLDLYIILKTPFALFKQSNG